MENVSNTEQDTLPPHCLIDLAIDLEAGYNYLYVQIYNLPYVWIYNLAELRGEQYFCYCLK